MTETASLKSLANNALERLERNRARNKTETNAGNLVSHPHPRETKNNGLSGRTFPPLPHLREVYEERLAIVEYEGRRDPLKAQQIAYLDAFIKVLSSLPMDQYSGDAWLNQMVRDAKKWLAEQHL